MKMAQAKSGDLIVVAINVTSGKITKVKGVERDKVSQMDKALEDFGFEADEEQDHARLQVELAKPTYSPILILHTESSPGCQWVYQDGRWRKVCK
jgi:hypothetical protein